MVYSWIRIAKFRKENVPGTFLAWHLAFVGMLATRKSFSEICSAKVGSSAHALIERSINSLGTAL